MNDMRKLMEAVKKAQHNDAATLPTIEQVTAWRVIDDMGEEVFHTDIDEAIIDYAESYAEGKTILAYSTDREGTKREWNKHYDQGKKIAQGLVSKGKK